MTKRGPDTIVEKTCISLLTNLDESICIIDCKLKILFANKKFQSEFSLEKDDSFRPIWKNCTTKNRSKTLPTKKTQCEIEMKSLGKTFLLIHTPTKKGQTRLFTEELRDITKQKEFEKSLKEYNDGLEYEIKRKSEDLRQRVATSEGERERLLNMMDNLNNAYKALEEEAIKKDELFDITSHELKTPLVPIEGFTEILIGECEKTDKTTKEQLLIIKTNVLRLKNLINNILSIARMQAHKLKFIVSKTSVSELIRKSVAKVCDEAKKRQIKISRPAKSQLSISCDKEKMEHALTHILDNAVKFNNDNGKIKIAAKKTKKFLLLSVEDTGRGIPSTDRDKIFDKFYQVDSSIDREVGGAGLGLAICKAIVEAHNGDIWVESQVNKGSTFFMRLPLDIKTIRQKDEDIYSSNVARLEEARQKLEAERSDLMTRV